MSTETPFYQAFLSSVTYSVTKGQDITNLQLEECARLFSDNYGVWSDEAAKALPFLRAGSRVKMNASKLRTQCLSEPSQTRLATCSVGGKLVGHAFATSWDSESGIVVWITQLVVAADERRCYHATSLLQLLRRDPLFRGASIFGLASSHPAACHALAKMSHIWINHIDIDFIRRHAKNVLSNSPIDYLKTAVL
ncbi:hypothetical protein AX16_003916 [Volvariella volvacea WC 439]|nr:hypothetical protein AX16_003916 [Volvariella volvacea WC 439]